MFDHWARRIDASSLDDFGLVGMLRAGNNDAV